MKIMHGISPIMKTGLAVALIVVLFYLGFLLVLGPEQLTGDIRAPFPRMRVANFKLGYLPILGGVAALALGWLAGAFTALYVIFFRANIFAY